MRRGRDDSSKEWIASPELVVRSDDLHVELVFRGTVVVRVVEEEAFDLAAALALAARQLVDRRSRATPGRPR